MTREFFQLAAVWLDCRGHLIEIESAGRELDQLRLWYFIGEMDYHAEMGLLVAELKKQAKEKDGPHN